MGSFLFILVVIVLVVVGKMSKRSSASSGPRRDQRLQRRTRSAFQQTRQQIEAMRQLQRGASSGGAWPPANLAPTNPSTPAPQPGAPTRAGARWSPPPAAPTTRAPATGPPTRPGAGPFSGPLAGHVAAPVPPVVADLQDDPDIRAFLPRLDGPADSDPTSSVLSDQTTERYVGSAALESTLDSTIESSLLGMPAGPVTMAVLPGGTALTLPPELRTQVVGFLDQGHEVAAVRLICDTLDCGILDAMRTVRSLD